MRVNIYYDGGPVSSTRIVDADTGKPVEWQAYRLDVDARNNGPMRAIISVYQPGIYFEDVDLIIETICPCCKQRLEIGGE